MVEISSHWLDITHDRTYSTWNYIFSSYFEYFSCLAILDFSFFLLRGIFTQLMFTIHFLFSQCEFGYISPLDHIFKLDVFLCVVPMTMGEPQNIFIYPFPCDLILLIWKIYLLSAKLCASPLLQNMLSRSFKGAYFSYLKEVSPL